MKYMTIAALLALTACDATALADKAVARTAESVITPVVGPGAARCIVDNGSPSELREIARDIGVEAGTSTVANIMEIAQRPETLACFAQTGVSPLRG
jgi:hypothetical protein